MKVKINFVLFTLLSAITAGPAAAALCSDTITDVIVHSSGRIYFTTANSCSQAWCEVAGSDAFVYNGYAMLMAAKIKQKPVIIQWNNLASCDSKNLVYTVPDFIILR